MAKCAYCQREMSTDTEKFPNFADGCRATHVKFKNRWYPRSKQTRADPGQRCKNCGAINGNFHHVDCEIEQCPKCGDPVVYCDCELRAYGER